MGIVPFCADVFLCQKCTLRFSICMHISQCIWGTMHGLKQNVTSLNCLHPSIFHASCCLHPSIHWIGPDRSIDPCITAGPTWNCATPKRSVHSRWAHLELCNNLTCRSVHSRWAHLRHVCPDPPNRSVHSDFPKSSSCACVHREHHAGALAAHVCVQIVVGATQIRLAAHVCIESTTLVLSMRMCALK